MGSEGEASAIRNSPRHAAADVAQPRAAGKLGSTGAGDPVSEQGRCCAQGCQPHLGAVTIERQARTSSLTQRQRRLTLEV